MTIALQLLTSLIRCKKLARSNELSCVTCGDRTHLVYCLDCDTAFCDGNGHIARHLKQFPGHNKLYSFKIRRQVRSCYCSIIYDVLNNIMFMLD